MWLCLLVQTFFFQHVCNLFSSIKPLYAEEWLWYILHLSLVIDDINERQVVTDAYGIVIVVM